MANSFQYATASVILTFKYNTVLTNVFQPYKHLHITALTPVVDYWLVCQMNQKAWA